MKGQYSLTSALEADLMRAPAPKKRLKIAMTTKEVIEELRGYHVDRAKGRDRTVYLICGLSRGKSIFMLDYLQQIHNQQPIAPVEIGENEVIRRLAKLHNISEASILNLLENSRRQPEPLEELKKVAEKLTETPDRFKGLQDFENLYQDKRPFYIRAADQGGIKKKRKRKF